MYAWLMFAHLVALPLLWFAAATIASRPGTPPDISPGAGGEQP